MIPPMAPCQTFVSLVRSCYSTRCRFFYNDETVETDITWYFTDADAKWCGLPNVFNSRNWYGGTIGWPLLGEVEGAARPWSDGLGNCRGHLGPFGSKEQWLEGASTSEAIASSPCFGPEDSLGFSETVTNMTVEMQPSQNMVKYGDNWSLPYPDPVAGPEWFTVSAKEGAVCCFKRGSTIAITGPPPGFAFVRSLDVVEGPGNGCSLIFVFDEQLQLQTQVLNFGPDG